MMLRTDITQLFKLADPTKAVMVVKHDYIPSTQLKYLNTKQYLYPRKNWSSLILFNNELCHELTPNYINNAPAMDLHQFKWVDDDSIGELPNEWNHLVGENEPNPNAKNIHWTLGGPYFKECYKVEYSEEWFKEYRQTIYCEQIKK